ncbi:MULTISPECIES: gamma-glutamyltransferase [unclassified Olleya]|jgi:gamma-glutamyltranspeptidase/glutathione hydrolase|uniref:gamma-glutamyltransferase n=1 Tax=unclassified Olleya TaxID=2615019 RepID=UPI00119DC721|nr:gamma-glutamyltransferase [Olleya sp. Hel_I_94]TVZ46133.1 gamma-glutamyltranspeptidase/glutathione hydrolase [Olleya sp. Hel_I_94]
MKNLALLFVICITFFSCKNNNKRGLITKQAMVVSAREEASKIGTAILKQGGNVFDAMIATDLALAVCYPYAGNIGGGGFMVYRLEDGSIGALDYREKAPKLATKNMYLDSLGNIIPNLSTQGGLAVGVPGTIAGLFEVHEKFGSLPIQDIMQPVIDLANRGFVVSQKDQAVLEEKKEAFLAVNKSEILFTKNWIAKDTIKQPNLAKTLEAIMINGRDEFYKGKTAKKLASFIQANGGVITVDDLSSYQAIWRKPITFEYDNLNIISMSPPSSGGICLAQILKQIEDFNLDEFGHNSLKSIQVITEAERRAYADRSFYLGDPDFVAIPHDQLLSDAYLKNRMADFTFDKATPSSTISHGKVDIIESDETTHYSIVDQFGNAIAVTTTLNSGYGSKLYSPKLGFFFNNEMDDFSSKPGTPNVYGLIGAEANSILPEKRMLSSMTPTIVEKNDKLYMTLGTPGGSTIITSVMQTILNVHEYDMTMQEAVNAPRFHHQWLPDQIRMEPNSFSKDLVLQLQQKGYSITEKNADVIGKVDGILVLDNGQLEGGADKRGDDTAIGF